jgi:hypothetical protein
MAFSFSVSNPARVEAVATASRARPGAGAASTVPAANKNASAMFRMIASPPVLKPALADAGRRRGSFILYRAILDYLVR